MEEHNKSNGLELIKNYIPVFDENIFSFKRKENGGYYSLRIHTIPRLQELFLNSTCFRILELCDGVRNSQEIVERMLSIYTDVEESIIVEDFVNIIKMLSRFQIISWKERNPFMEEFKIEIDEFTFKLLDDTDIRSIIDFIRNNEDKLQWINLMNDYRHYDELYIREMLFNYSEDFFALQDKEHSIVGIISLKHSINIKSSVSHIGILICDSKYIEKMIKGLVTFSGNSPLNKNIAKIKVQILYDSMSYYENLINSLKSNEFNEENISKKEFKGKDLVNYSFYL